jgi:hypothetical protein
LIITKKNPWENTKKPLDISQIIFPCKGTLIILLNLKKIKDELAPER